MDYLKERIYCVCGELDDLICDDSLRKLSFIQYFAEYLKKKEQFDYVVFYLASRGMRVFDEDSAQLIGENRTESTVNQDYEEDENYFAEEDEDDLIFDRPIPKHSEAVNENNSSKEGGKTESGHSGKEKPLKKTIYSSRLEVAEFVSLMDNLLRDSEKKTAIVFESINDYMQLTPDDRAQFEATLQYFLSDSLDDNQNQVFFLAMNMDLNQIYTMIGNNDRLGSIFFMEQTGSPSVREERFLEIGKPMKDEIVNLLEHYRLYGYKKRFLKYSLNELGDIAYLLECYAERARACSLNDINRVLQKGMDNVEKREILVDAKWLRSLYPRVRKMQLPLEFLAELEYTEDVINRLHSIKKLKGIRPDGERRGIHRMIPADMLPNNFSRFVLSGIEGSNRTKTALTMADFLYSIGEVSSKQHMFINKNDIRNWTIPEMNRIITELVKRAEKKVLILDDLDCLIEGEEGKKRIQTFHRCLKEALSRDRGLHFILVVNAAKEKELFTGADLEEYEIPERNILRLLKEIPADTGHIPVNRQEVAGGR